MSQNNISAKRQALTRARRVVVKIGSALLTRGGHGLNVEGIDDWATQIAGLRRQKVDVVLVTSGAVAAGMQRLGRASRPHALHELQAMAAVGQMGLVQAD